LKPTIIGDLRCAPILAVTHVGGSGRSYAVRRSRWIIFSTHYDGFARDGQLVRAALTDSQLNPVIS